MYIDPRASSFSVCIYGYAQDDATFMFIERIALIDYLEKFSSLFTVVLRRI